MKINEGLLVFFGYVPQFLLAWALAGLVAVAAASPECARLELGLVGGVMNVALGSSVKQVLVYLAGFYFVAGMLLSLAGRHQRVEEVERAFFRPIFVPALAQLSGFFAGIAMPEVNAGDYTTLWIAGATVLLALVSYNFSMAMRWAYSN